MGGRDTTLRFCSRCRADVEDAGGYCLLGHPFPPDTSDSMLDLRDQVDEAFAKVKLDFAALETPQDSPAPPEPYEELRTSDQHLIEEMTSSRRDYWSELREVVDKPIERDDPILAFSPSPRMEWGPTKNRRRNRP